MKITVVKSREYVNETLKLVNNVCRGPLLISGAKIHHNRLSKFQRFIINPQHKRTRKFIRINHNRSETNPILTRSSLQIGSMKGANTIPENGKENERPGPEMKPEFGPGTLNIKVSHGLNDHEVAVPSNSSFGDLKSIIVQKIGLKPETHKLLFRGKEKEDDEYLETAGVKDNLKVLLMEDMMTSRQENPEEVKETDVISRGAEAVAQVREEVDKLANQVSALQAVVDSGTKVDDKYIIYLTEMLMRQLLKLDGIDAEGEGKVQRKLEVHRVQSFVETMDSIKTRNSNPFINGNKTTSVTTQWETFEPACGSAGAPSPVPSPSPTPSPLPSHDRTPIPTPTPVPSFAASPIPFSTKVTKDWEHFD